MTRVLNGLMYNFPRTQFVSENGIVFQTAHVLLEAEEARFEASNLNEENPDIYPLAMEIMDIYHSAETALRILEEQYGVDVQKLMHDVALKNDARGYYDAAS